MTLAGINCVYEPAERRAQAWNRLARDLDTAKLDSMTDTIGLAEVPTAAAAILAGEIRGRVVIDVNKVAKALADSTLEDREQAWALTRLLATRT